MIDTPYSDYSPDWAIIYRSEGHLKLYFVVETKAGKGWGDLTDVEKSKMKCGELHFKGVSDEIKFDWVNCYKDFKQNLLT